MRPIIAITLLASATATLLAADRYVNAESYPRLRVKSVTVPQARSQPLQIAFEIASVGKTPVAISQKQFSVWVFAAEQPVLSVLFVGLPVFPANSPQVFRISPDKPMPLTVTVSTNSLPVADHPDRPSHWGDLPAGSYTLRVYVNSDKVREFDYQWLGQTYSDDYKLVIK